MSEQNKLHADGYFVFETESGIIGRTIATFTRAEDAAEYVKLKARVAEAEAALADRIEHCEKHHSGNSAIVKTLANQHGQAFAVYLSDGQKINIQRDGGAAWLRIEPTPIVREAGEDGA